MNERYIEIYSKHRNRQLYPEQSSFEIPFMTLPQKNPYDPVLNGMIYFYYEHKTPLDEGTVSLGSSDSSIVIHSSLSSTYPTLYNYYVGCALSIVTPSGLQTRLIVDYSPGTLRLTPDVSFNNIAPTQPYIIYDFSTREFLHIIIPSNDSSYLDLLGDDQSCTGYFVMDETLSYGRNIVARQIKFYDFSLRYAYYDTSMPNNWQPTDVYTIRKTLPFEKWILPVDSVIENGYVYVTFPLDASATDNFYNKLYIYFYIDQHIQTTLYILSYDGASRRAKCNLTFAPLPKQGDTINIVTFSHDNFSPLDYIGTMVSMNEAVSYEIALLRLVLPNVPLKSGSRVAFYPYLYVELSNVSSPMTMSQNIIYSNNPESGRALFIVPVRDMVMPVNSHFVKLIGRTRQTVKFKPNDALRFSVFLPSGELFLTYQKDMKSPYEPNYRLQINAVFAIRRL
jgi:hypothetical protein